MEKIKQEAIELLNNCEVVSLASIDEHGYPRPVVISKIKIDGIDTIWFSTGTSSEKTKNFIDNPKAGISFFKEGDSVTLTGTVTIVNDAAEKKALWVDWFYEHFPKGVDDPEYCILKFTAEQATYWIGHKFVKGKV